MKFLLHLESEILRQISMVQLMQCFYTMGEFSWELRKLMP